MGTMDGYREDGVFGEVNDLLGGAFDDLTGTLITVLVVLALVRVAIAVTPRRFRPLTRLVGLGVAGISLIAILS